MIRVKFNENTFHVFPKRLFSLQNLFFLLRSREIFVDFFFVKKIIELFFFAFFLQFNNESLTLKI